MAGRLDLQLLRLLVTLQKHRTLVIAARSLNVTQSALSHQLCEGERRLSAKLVERVGRRLRLTTLGEQLLDVGMRVVPEIERAEADLKYFATWGEPPVRIGSHAHNTHHWLTRFLAYRTRKGGQSPIQLVCDSMAHRIASLEDRTIDIAILPSGGLPSNTRGIELFADELVAVVPRRHALAKKRAISARDFEQDVYLSYSMIIEEGMEFTTILRDAGVNLRAYADLGHVDAVLSAIEAGCGIAILPLTSASPRLQSRRLAIRPLLPRNPRIAWKAILRAEEPEDSRVSQVAIDLQHWCGQDNMRRFKTGGAA